MLFNSLDYLVFLPLVVCSYFLLPFRVRSVFLLVSSYYFYACWRPEYTLLMLFTSCLDWFAALRIANTEQPQARRSWLACSLIANLGILFLFKYLAFFCQSTEMVFRSLNILVAVPELKILLPVGISFYTFQSLAYTMDVYRGEIPAEKSLVTYALYVAYFPQMVAGPIERAANLLPQYKLRHSFRLENLALGARLIVWGMFKKVVIADRLALAVNTVYADPAAHSSLTLLVATYCFALQIYCDFSGYSDIAVGSARMMGFQLMANFRRPYLATSLTDFWRRWHIALSTWFRDYLYVPLGGNRVSQVRWSFNILLVFLVSGLWHGANWTYVVWGGIHGVGLVLERFLGVVRWGARNWILRWSLGLVTFHLVLLAWTFFRASTIGEAGLIVSRIVTELDFTSASAHSLLASLGLTLADARIALLAVGLLVLAELALEFGWVTRWLSWFPGWSGQTLQMTFFYVLGLLTAATVTPQSQQFIYFQF